MFYRKNNKKNIFNKQNNQFKPLIDKRHAWTENFMYLFRKCLYILNKCVTNFPELA